MTECAGGALGAGAGRLGLPDHRARGLRRPDPRPRERAAAGSRPSGSSARAWRWTRSSRTTSSTSTMPTAPTTPRDGHAHRGLRARPDVGAVVHGHPPYATALGATSARLSCSPTTRSSSSTALGVFDEAAELITEHEQGARGRGARDAASRAAAQPRRRHRRRGRALGGPHRVTLERAIRFQAIASPSVSCGPSRRSSRRAARRQVPGALPRRVLGGLGPAGAARGSQHGMPPA